MTMTLRLNHHAGYTYRGGASASYNEARVQPQSNVDQTVLHTKVDVSPQPWSTSWTDYWGTLVTSFEVHERHPELVVDATSTVTVDRRAVHSERLSWEQMGSRETADQWLEVLQVGSRVAPGDGLAVRLTRLREASADPTEFVTQVGRLLREQLEVDLERTAVHREAAGAWEAGSACPQDLAQLMIGALRSQGIPARYVTGYMLPQADPEIGQPYVGVAYAWVQWWDGAWVPLDPARGRVPDDHYVEVGVGRDHQDVVPLRGIFTGSPGSTMFVRVDITRIA